MMIKPFSLTKKRGEGEGDFFLSIPWCAEHLLLGDIWQGARESSAVV